MSLFHSLLWRVASRHLSACISNSNLFEPLQFVLRACHSILSCTYSRCKWSSDWYRFRFHLCFSYLMQVFDTIQHCSSGLIGKQRWCVWLMVKHLHSWTIGCPEASLPELFVSPSRCFGCVSSFSRIQTISFFSVSLACSCCCCVSLTCVFAHSPICVNGVLGFWHWCVRVVCSLSRSSW